jgi:hypothetical protein
MFESGGWVYDEPECGDLAAAVQMKNGPGTPMSFVFGRSDVSLHESPKYSLIASNP